MIQHSVFEDGSFVLHNITLNGHKYSAWFNSKGVVFSAERFSTDNTKVFNVPLDKQLGVAEQLNRVGKRYAK